MVHVARDTGHFTFLSTCLPSASFVIGDARLTLGKATGAFDLIILDAFSSDAIPIHLITREALALYLRKLAPGGVLFFHITNRHLDLAPVLGDLAQNAGLAAIIQRYEPSVEDTARGGLPSTWVAMARREEDLGTLPHDARWRALTGRPHATPWSDDFSNLVTALKGTGNLLWEGGDPPLEKGPGTPFQTSAPRSASPVATDVSSSPPVILAAPKRWTKICLTAGTNDEPPVRKT